MRVDVLTLFPEVFSDYLGVSIMQRAQAAGLLQVALHDLRMYGVGRHRVTDDTPYGGGGGMILKPEPIFAAVDTVRASAETATKELSAGQQARIILLSPQGRQFTQAVAQELSQHDWLVLVCGRYEGVDERVRQSLIDDEISIGDYVLTGGELPALILIDAVTRLLPGALGDEHAPESDSHATGLLEGPHYTRPADFKGMKVPELLRIGHAAHIERWRREQALRRTWRRRPDMLITAPLSEEDKMYLATLAEEQTESDDRKDDR